MAVRREDEIAADTLPGNGVLIHRQVSETVGLYNATWLPHYHADSELILRAQKDGFKAYVAPNIVLKNDFSAAQKRVCLKTLAGLQWTLFAKKSHLYAPAILYIVLKYAPWGQKLRTLTALLGRMLQIPADGLCWLDQF
ncbi:hypothetical protein IQ241_22085 [Romeria aff. gracilis LEGE 07310]|uniref:Uncharacterized protein n=1 Tax=Vasconcelosia minhoensis LEGE 07310 TaxID=915328 RepID=A0A8J7ABJ0_9CYAN|nr:hypothetical protein [Romeria gracilis]MBE9079945.1 hypothetical protein [Romeria aff. gracilis LEGE 07310]